MEKLWNSTESQYRLFKNLPSSSPSYSWKSSFSDGGDEDRPVLQTPNTETILGLQQVFSGRRRPRPQTSWKFPKIDVLVPVQFLVLEVLGRRGRGPSRPADPCSVNKIFGTRTSSPRKFRNVDRTSYFRPSVGA